MTHAVTNKLLRKFDHVLTTGKPVEIRFHEGECGIELVFATYSHAPSDSEFEEVLDYVFDNVGGTNFIFTHLLSVTM